MGRVGLVPRVLMSTASKRWEEWGLVPRVLSSTASKRWGEWGLVPRALSSTASKGWEEGAQFLGVLPLKDREYYH